MMVVVVVVIGNFSIRWRGSRDHVPVRWPQCLEFTFLKLWRKLNVGEGNERCVDGYELYKDCFYWSLV